VEEKPLFLLWVELLWRRQMLVDKLAEDLVDAEDEEGVEILVKLLQ
jgi:hypothetical protein